MLAPYERSLTNASRSERRAWAQEVLDALRVQLGGLSLHSFEIHAGAAYRDFGLEVGLRQAGARVEVPTQDSGWVSS